MAKTARKKRSKVEGKLVGVADEVIMAA